MTYVTTVGTMCQLLHGAKRLPSRRTFQEMICVLGSTGIPLKDPFEFTPAGVYSATVEAKLDRMIEEGYVRQSGQHLLILPRIRHILKLADMPLYPVWTESILRLLRMPADYLEALSTMALLCRIDRVTHRICTDFAHLRPDWAAQTDMILQEITTLREQYGEEAP